MSIVKSELKIGRELGSGQFGTVCKGKDPVHGTVAVKTPVRRRNESDDEWAARKDELLSEGVNLKKAQHQNVVQIYNVVRSEDGSSVHLIMERCREGCLLDAYKKGPLDIEKVRKYCSDVLLGLAFLHGKNLLHRDIKPSNIMISNGRAKIGDFGLVTDKIVLGYASGCGYSDHLPPEVLNGVAGTSVRSDIWAMGMTTYRLLHGERWYQRMPQRPQHLAVKGGLAASLLWLPHVPKAWRSYIRKCLNDDAAYRFQSASIAQQRFSALPISPVWGCEVEDDKVTWSRLKGDRLITVSWERMAARKYDWLAVSAPIGHGISRRLGGGQGLSLAKSDVQLTKFFEKQT